ncbi:MAG: site-specific integrase, partial [Acidimicrobiales bacterium]
MARKRRRLGGIDRLASGRYRVRVTDEATGDRVSLGTFASKADAERALAKAIADQSRRRWVRPGAGTVLLEDYAHQWVASRLGRNGAPLRPRVHELYAGLLRLHILPSLGHVPLGKLRPATIRTWYAAMIKRRPGASTVAKCYRLLHAILNSAVDDGVLVANPCSIRGAGAEHAAERKVPTLGQVHELADRVKPRYRALVLAAAFSGLRRGELFGLRREHIDLDDGTLTVEVQRQQLSNGQHV